MVALQTITKEELAEKLERGDNVQVVNVLEPESYHLGFIKGTKRIPLSQLDRRMSELDRMQEVVTYCAGPECPASRQAAEKLSAEGFDVRAYEGGIKEWKEAELPTE